MRKPLCCFVGAAILAGLVGCNNQNNGTVSALNTEAPRKTAFLVEASRPERRDVSEFLSETGIITAENQVEVLAKGTGHCVSLFVEEGDAVEKDQVLAELDKMEMEAQVRQSEVNLSQQVLAFERADKGYKQGIISAAERDNARAAQDQAKASLDMQKVQLGFLTIRAPISGVVTKRHLQAGMLVTSGMPVFNIVDPTSFVLPIFVTERSLPRLRIGQEARVTIDSSGDREFLAHVRRINPGVDSQTGSVKVILDFAAEDLPYLRESAFARYSLVMDTHPNVLVVPKDAILEENARRYLMVAQAAPASAPEAPAPAEGDAETTSLAAEAPAPEADGATPWVAARVEVETGLEDSSYTEIVSGIDSETQIITLGQQTVNEGDYLEIGNLEDTLESRGAVTADEALEKAKSEGAQGRSPKGPGGRKGGPHL